MLGLNPVQRITSPAELFVEGTAKKKQDKKKNDNSRGRSQNRRIRESTASPDVEISGSRCNKKRQQENDGQPLERDAEIQGSLDQGFYAFVTLVPAG